VREITAERSSSGRRSISQAAASMDRGRSSARARDVIWSGIGSIGHGIDLLWKLGFGVDVQSCKSIATFYFRRGGALSLNQNPIKQQL
jgi:hypothetical protein